MKERSREIKKTKIVCTIGPSSSEPTIMEEMIREGMDVARLNFSHGDHEGHAEKITQVKRLSAKTGRPVAILQDLGGGKVRVGEIEGGTVSLDTGATITLTTKLTKGNAEKISVTYPGLTNDVKEGDTILLADGTLELKVVAVNPPEIICHVVVGGELSSHKGVNIPSGQLRAKALTDKDREDLLFGARAEVDFIALSYVRGREDIQEAKELLRSQDVDIPVIAKIERHEALGHIEEIMNEADGIMVARGDLGVEIPLEEVPLVQKALIKRANALGKPVITATQMLRSMVENPRPTRAEASDVANAILDGTDAIMLSEETAIGRYPVEAVKFMVTIAQATEKSFPHEAFLPPDPYQKGEIADSMSHAACQLAEDLGVAAIITPTRTGRTARLVSRYRPRYPILAFSPKSTTVRRLILSWGVHPILVPEFTNVDEIVGKGITAALQRGWVTKGQRVVVTAGTPIDLPGTTNLITVEEL
ncbi:MAG: pyruvate kinase [Deltaproteobacteria bacterium RBG_13_52_11]|nr:MAG: pyruvate kinase [Deltaproteobacteria bacterium RBG_13_52_11]